MRVGGAPRGRKGTGVAGKGERDAGGALAAHTPAGPARTHTPAGPARTHTPARPARTHTPARRAARTKHPVLAHEQGSRASSGSGGGGVAPGGRTTAAAAVTPPYHGPFLPKTPTSQPPASHGEGARRAWRGYGVRQKRGRSVCGMRTARTVLAVRTAQVAKARRARHAHNGAHRWRKGPRGPGVLCRRMAGRLPPCPSLRGEPHNKR